MGARSKLSAADVSGYLSSLDLKPAQAPDPELRESYRAAAAVLAAINDPKSLKPLSGEAGLAETVLAGDLVPTGAARNLGGSLMLRHDIRRGALRNLSTSERMQYALSFNWEQRSGLLQQHFETYMLGVGTPLRHQSITHLELTLQVALWLEGTKLPNLPSVQEVQTALGRARLEGRFQKLAGAHFHGRVDELDRLRNFVGLISAETVIHKVRGAISSGLSRLFNLKPKPAMSVHGPGGIGKTALVMRFFLEHINAPIETRVPFCYIDFDSPFININDLSTVASEMYRQLAIQYPQEMTDPAEAGPVEGAVGSMLERLSVVAEQPFLIVLDTFEEVQYGGEARAYPLWDLLSQLQQRYPFLRVLISGRAPVSTLKLAGEKPIELALEGLDTDAAVAMVQAAGVEDKEFAAALVKQVGRVPLSLRLAAALVLREGMGKRGVRNLDTKSYLFLSLSDEVIQGQLYERVLGHIHNPEVVKLAHPGLVLRRMNAEVILEVLKDPCDLSITTKEGADLLYAELARETALVAEETDGWLKHRQDLRRTMLKLLLEKQPKRAEQIHKRAIEYYSKKEGAAATAEELYHRFMLGGRWSPIEQLRKPEVRASLSQSVTELPDATRVLLDEAISGERQRQELDDSSAPAFLRALGIQAAEIARALVRQVGRVPLSLRLAAALVLREGIEKRGVRNLETKSYLFLSLSDEVIQGQLYQRVLGHIHNPEVVKLAYRGLVLRRMNAEVILEVLKGPCELAITTKEEANLLYSDLARETALVAEETNGWLKHRPDLRRVILKLLVAEQPAEQPKRAEEIHRRAIEYYSGKDGSDAIAEELYHRFMIGGRWSPVEQLASTEVRASLSQSIGELPVRAQLFLGEFGYEVSGEILEQASEQERQNHIAARVTDMLPHGQTAAKDALLLMKEIEFRGTNSPLYICEARAAFLVGDLERTVSVTEEGIRCASEAGDIARALDLLCLAAWTYEELGQWKKVSKRLPYLGQYAERLEARLPRIQYWAQKLRFARSQDLRSEVMDAAKMLGPLLEPLQTRDYLLIAPILKNVFEPVTALSPEPIRRFASVFDWSNASDVGPLLWLLQRASKDELFEARAKSGPDYYPLAEVSYHAETISVDLERLLDRCDSEWNSLVAETVDKILERWSARLPYLSRGAR